MPIQVTFGTTQAITTVQYTKREGTRLMNDGRLLRILDNGTKFMGDDNIYTIHPKKSELILFYEVVTPEGENEWGGANAEHCIQWLSLAPSGSRVLVSAWDSDEEDAHLVGQTLDITEIVRAASL
jgi:hypothetical protein